MPSEASGGEVTLADTWKCATAQKRWQRMDSAGVFALPSRLTLEERQDEGLHCKLPARNRTSF
jgi:hypothetical protein